MGRPMEWMMIPHIVEHHRHHPAVHGVVSADVVAAELNPDLDGVGVNSRICQGGISTLPAPGSVATRPAGATLRVSSCGAR